MSVEKSLRFRHKFFFLDTLLIYLKRVCIGSFLTNKRHYQRGTKRSVFSFFFLGSLERNGLNEEQMFSGGKNRTPHYIFRSRVDGVLQ